MAPPKSQRLLRDEMRNNQQPPESEPSIVLAPGELIKIKPVPVFNDFVAILLFRFGTGNIELGESGWKNEGIIIGAGPGIPTSSGTRCPVQVKVGDVVSFYGKPYTDVTPQSGVYAGRKIYIISERNLTVGLPPVPYEIIQDEKPATLG